MSPVKSKTIKALLANFEAKEIDPEKGGLISESVFTLVISSKKKLSNHNPEVGLYTIKLRHPK